MNAWAKFLTKFYKDKKRTQKNYMFKDAMKDAQKVYKKQGGAQKAQKSKSNRSRKMRGGDGEDEEELATPAAVEPNPADVEPTPAAVEPTPAAVEPTPAADAEESTIAGGKSRRNRGGKSQRKSNKARRGGKSQRRSRR